jgi:hypothetical protein
MAVAVEYTNTWQKGGRDQRPPFYFAMCDNG